MQDYEIIRRPQSAPYPEKFLTRVPYPGNEPKCDWLIVRTSDNKVVGGGGIRQEARQMRDILRTNPNMEIVR